MALRSIKSFERRWAKLKRLAAAQLKDFERDRKEIAREIKRRKLRRDLEQVREAVMHSRRVERVIRQTKQLIAVKDRAVVQAKRRGRLLKRALS
jgi:hypothetical protein